MSEELKKAEEQVRQARYESWKRMAQKLENHHILAVEMFRTEDDHTLAVFTVVRDGEPVQEILRANSRGTDVHAVVPKHEGECKPIRWWPFSPFHQVEAMSLMSLMAPAAASASGGDGGASPDAIALGEPPPKQDPEPGIVATGTSILPTVFDLGERATGGGSDDTSNDT